MQANHDLTIKDRERTGRWVRLQSVLQRRRVTVSFLFAVLALFIAQPTVPLIGIGGGISLLGAGLRAWAAGHLRKDEVLCTGGPYAYTRNPLYLGSFLLGLGVVTATGSFALFVIFLSLFFLFFSSAMAREAEHLGTLFPEDYRLYRASVPAFFPRLTPYPRAARGRFEMALYRSHGEYRVVLILLLLLGLFLAKTTFALAQTLPEVRSQIQSLDTPHVPDPLPFVEGESLEYEAHFSKLLISGKVGRISFTFDRSAEPPLLQDYLIKVNAVSEGVWMRLMGLKVEDVFESFIDPGDFSVHRTRKRYHHGPKKWFELSVFDKTLRSVMIIKRDLTRLDAKPEVSHQSTRAWVQDMISGIYYLRSLPLNVGQTITLPLCDSGKTMDIEVKVVGREQIHIGLGSFDTVKVQPLVFGKEKLIHKEGEMFVWMTDDARHIPLRSWVHGKFGTATVELKSIKHLND